ncbi:MAG: NUDIX hydrolase [Ignavibacteriae bacterium]|nr:MAG: NUDIX hydrolase [Ignavibacteriota bacterium]
MALPKTIKSERLYHGRIIDLIVEDVEDAPGRVRKREIVSHPGGSVIVPLFDNGQVLLVRQYRYPLQKFILEVPAGKLEPNEDPLQAARRELQEETGFTADHYEKLTAMFTTPGFCSEVLHIYLATGLKQSKEGQHLDEGEQSLTVEIFPLSTVVEMIERGEIADSKTIAGILLTERKLRLKANEPLSK